MVGQDTPGVGIAGFDGTDCHRWGRVLRDAKTVHGFRGPRVVVVNVLHFHVDLWREINFCLIISVKIIDYFLVNLVQRANQEKHRFRESIFHVNLWRKQQI